MATTVHHYFPLGSSDIGDHLAAQAIRTSFVRFFGTAEFVDMPVNDRYRAGDRLVGLRGSNLLQTNREADLLVIGGSNLLEPRKVPRRGTLQSRHDWGVFTDVESIHQLAPPLLLVGMGTGSGFGSRIREYTPRAADEIRALHASAFASAVRDITTVRALTAIDVLTTCTGSPIAFLTDRDISAGSRNQPLIVSFPPERILRKRGGPAFMRMAMKYIVWLRQVGVSVVVTLHEARDLDVVHQWIPSGCEIFYTEDVKELIARYEDSRGVVGFRLHAALLGLGLGKPVVPVGLDGRGQAFVDTFALGDLAIRPGQWGQLGKLRAVTRLLLENDRRLLDRLNAKKGEFRDRYEAFWQKAAAPFKQSRAG